MLLAPENTTPSTAACVKGVDGATAGGVGWKLSRMTSTEAVCADVTAPVLRAGACASAVIESGVIVAPMRVPVTATRMPGFMSVGAIGTSSSTPPPLSSSSVQTKRLVPTVEIVGVQKLQGAFHGHLRGRSRGRFAWPWLLLLDDQRAMGGVSGNDERHSLAHGRVRGECDPGRGPVAADESIDTLVTAAVDEVEDRHPSLERHGRALRHSGHGRSLVHGSRMVGVCGRNAGAGNCRDGRHGRQVLD